MYGPMFKNTEPKATYHLIRAKVKLLNLQAFVHGKEASVETDPLLYSWAMNIYFNVSILFY